MKGILMILIGLDALAVIILGLLVSRGLLSIYAATLLGWGIMLPVNVALAFRYSKQRNNGPVNARAVSIRAWIGSTILFTIVAIAAIINMTRTPHIFLVEVIGSIILVGYLWFIIRMLGHMRP